VYNLVVRKITKDNMDEEKVVETGHCMKCKEKREMKETEEVEMKNGRKAMKGVCSECGTKMFKILGTKKVEAAE